MKVLHAKSQKEIADHFYVRGMVFVVEQQIDYKIEFDGLDGECVLFVAYIDEKPVGAARLYKDKVGRVATLKSYRHMGVASRLMDKIESYASKHQINILKLHAQLYIKDFYQNRGYKPHGEVFQEACIDHIKMTKTLI
ncbi:MAG TPA: GNAT family N-acetyltransferase [Candidatus Izemoplasmatales bacterium]|nr:GNAT family N-acetyltransferase [Candidatus Izemoplasmatales bacterium]